MLINIKVLCLLFIKNFSASTCEFFASVQLVNTITAEAGGRVVSDVDLKLLHCWDRGFESRSQMFMSGVCCVLCR